MRVLTSEETAGRGFVIGKTRASLGVIYVEWHEDDLHIWVGPVGLHLFWPDLWKSRPDWCADWRS